MKKATLLFSVVEVSQCENKNSKPSSGVLVSDRLCSRLNVAGISDVCKVNADLNEDDLMIGGGVTGGL